MAKLVNLYLDGKFPISTNRLNHFDRLFGQALFGGVEKTVDFSPIISVSDALAKPAIDLQCKITAVQEGSGDPSPVNIRNIVGWNGLTLHVNSSEIPVTWQTEAGTVYGGVVDLTTGVLTVTWGIMDLGSRNWTFRESGATQYFESGTIADKAIGNFNVICDIYKTSTSTTVSGMGNYEIKGNASNKALYIKNPDYTDGDAFKTAMQGKYVCFELATS